MNWGVVDARRWIITKVRDDVESDLDLWNSLWDAFGTDTNKLLTLSGTFRADIHTCRLCLCVRTNCAASVRWRNDGNSKWGPFKNLRQRFIFLKRRQCQINQLRFKCQNRLFILSRPSRYIKTVVRTDVSPNKRAKLPCVDSQCSFQSYFCEPNKWNTTNYYVDNIRLGLVITPVAPTLRIVSWCIETRSVLSKNS